MGKIKLKRALELDVIDFAENTSAHGIPRAYVSNGCRRWLWLSFFFICLFAFSYQAFLIIQRFNRNDIMVGVEIKFEEIRFPAVTICNMNPYKNSAAREIPEIKTALEHFEEHILKTDVSHLHTTRKKRSNLKMIPVDVSCQEENGFYTPNILGSSECTCAGFEEEDGYLWNCYPFSEWSHRICEWKDELFSTCKCHDGFCLTDETKFHVAWPLHAHFPKNSSKLCISQIDASSKMPEFCSHFDHFHVSSCNNCDWLGKCDENFESEFDQKCICHHSTCFQIKNVKKSRNKRGLIAQKRVHEKLFTRYEGLMAIYSDCRCKKPEECEWLKTKPEDNSTYSECLCFYNRKNTQVWPCYTEEYWEERKCGRCNTLGDCQYAKNEAKAKNPCLCAKPIGMCVWIEPPDENNSTLEERLVNYWDVAPTTTTSPIQKKKAQREKAYGYTGVTDLIALRAKAMENIIFAVDALTEQQKWRISYDKFDFIRKCSFNGRECNVKQDFKAYLDPTYGACFTYGHNQYENNTNERPGPAYGLRLEVFVNVTEYLPSTESAGVRLTVHSHDEYPFPDTAGFSAPVGFVSSFGIKLKSMERLGAPYGECLNENEEHFENDYIYKNTSYSTEGCQRSCIQKHLTRNCGCGDPRFPVYQQTRNCLVDDIETRNCIKREIMNATRNSKKIGCSCKQPCIQDVYSVSYSASRWPAVAGDLSGCPHGMSASHCLTYKREQGSMIEVYFEQLNYEYLKETAAYGWSNLLSDFGGQLGLWMGVSVITIMEVSIFICDVITSIIGLRPEKRRPARKSFSSSLRCSRDYNINKDGIIN
ncbi:unnamed protein product [Caenorhabditis angaria]|uniref:Uncharacterized protein n=1 Tax=Caenorhabditis angaria TaxID=860376 RepID=A0A9P1I6I4_9PELO|nr:unnamed protein product [Caenorhabditis angaria]